MDSLVAAVRAVKRLLIRVTDPLTADEEITQFTLSVPGAQTTTVEGAQGKRNRPPAVLRCPGCASAIYQMRSFDDIDCRNCWREFPSEEFPEFEVLAMICPRCESEMEFGRRHPRVFDEPEWATCPRCQYHWDLDHWF